MSINVESREKYRKALALFLKARCETPKNVLDHVPVSFVDASGNLAVPMMCVTGAPTNRILDTADGAYENKFGLAVRNFTLYQKEGETWTPAQAEDMLDRLEWEVSVALKQASKQNRDNPWRAISRNGLSIIEGPYILGGVHYLTEIIPVIVEVEDDEEED